VTLVENQTQLSNVIFVVAVNNAVRVNLNQPRKDQMEEHKS
jgi:hypothetical protein